MKFLIDENLPEDIYLWKMPDFIHARTLGLSVDDGQIWNFAKDKKLTIVSKNADFSNRILVTDPPSRVIHMRIGNMKFESLEAFVTKHWAAILEYSKTHKLVNVHLDSIEGIN